MHFARWAHIHRFLSVCPSGLDQNDWTIIHILKSIRAKSLQCKQLFQCVTFPKNRLLHVVYANLKVGSLPTSSSIFSDLYENDPVFTHLPSLIFHSPMAMAFELVCDFVEMHFCTKFCVCSSMRGHIYGQTNGQIDTTKHIISPRFMIDDQVRELGDHLESSSTMHSDFP